MILPKIVVTKEDDRYDLQLARGADRGSEVEKAFLKIAERHALGDANTGCYEVIAKTTDGGNVHLLGGIYVPPDRLNAVLADLRTQGYEVERKTA
jgi:hypothetical protein